MANLKETRAKIIREWLERYGVYPRWIISWVDKNINKLEEK